MHARVRPVVIGQSTADPCASCDARPYSVCSAIEDADLARLATTAVSIEIDKGVTFIEEGEAAADFFNVTAGTIKLYKLLADGRQQITGFARAGSFLGLAVSNTYAFSAEAIEPVRLCRFSRPRLRQLLDDFPALEKRLLETACNELAAAQEQMLLLGRKTARERVASFLLAQSAATHPCGQPQPSVHLPMTRAEIGDYLGLTIETVSRTLSKFKAEHRIFLGAGHEIVLLDRPWLQSVADGEVPA